jgi:ferredoxin
MPKVSVHGKTFHCEPDANLRQELLKQGIDLYNGAAALVNCHGIGSCGTCAVEIIGEVSAPNWRDRTRRSLPPHNSTRNLRLACQTKVLGDITVQKYDGFWGQGQSHQWKEISK